MIPARTGSSGQGPTKPVHRSVPPEKEPSSRSLRTRSYTQPNASGGSGDPVEPMARNADRAASSPGAPPRLQGGPGVGPPAAQVAAAVPGGQPPQPVRAGVGGAAVVQHDRQ